MLPDELDDIDWDIAADIIFGNQKSEAGNIFVPPPELLQPVHKPIPAAELLRTSSCAHAIDPEAITSWVYPTNYPVREYQFNIVQRALFENTLVSIPTGLGKTLIAAVVMYNFRRWFPESKIIFMAPTRPLVVQQQRACYIITGVPLNDTAVFVGGVAGATSSRTGALTAASSPNEREFVWRTKRMFFATPQTVQNDLARGRLDGKTISCLVVDEAHRALGKAPYVDVVRRLAAVSSGFRILALSATPGASRESIEEVCTNLRIAHIELRTETSPDLAPYTFKCLRETIVTRLTGDFLEAQRRLAVFAKPSGSRLVAARAIRTADPISTAPFTVLDAQRRYHNANRGTPNGVLSGYFGAFHLFCSLAETLSNRSLRSFHSALSNLRTDILSGTQKPYRPLLDMIESTEYKAYIAWLSSVMRKPSFVAHPKMAELQRIILEHFTKANSTGVNQTKVIIFANHRAVVAEIDLLLRQHAPIVRVHSFVGQSLCVKSNKAAGDTGKGQNQRQQHEVLQNFKKNILNTLVSTSVGEEGLDIGEVDLIICYDTSQSPVKIVQRMGRTGRRRTGRVVFLLTAGREEANYARSLAKQKSVVSILGESKKSLQLYPSLSCRMIPSASNPICIRMHLNVASAEENEDAENSHIFGKSRQQKDQDYGPYLSPNEMLDYLNRFEVKEDIQLCSINSIIKKSPISRKIIPKHKIGSSSTTKDLINLYEFLEGVERIFNSQDNNLIVPSSKGLFKVFDSFIDDDNLQLSVDSLPELYPSFSKKLSQSFYYNNNLKSKVYQQNNTNKVQENDEEFWKDFDNDELLIGLNLDDFDTDKLLMESQIKIIKKENLSESEEPLLNDDNDDVVVVEDEKVVSENEEKGSKEKSDYDESEIIILNNPPSDFKLNISHNQNFYKKIFQTTGKDYYNYGPLKSYLKPEFYNKINKSTSDINITHKVDDDDVVINKEEEKNVESDLNKINSFKMYTPKSTKFNENTIISPLFNKEKKENQHSAESIRHVVNFRRKIKRVRQVLDDLSLTSDCTTTNLEEEKSKNNTQIEDDSNVNNNNNNQKKSLIKKRRDRFSNIKYFDLDAIISGSSNDISSDEENEDLIESKDSFIDSQEEEDDDDEIRKKYPSVIGGFSSSGDETPIYIKRYRQLAHESTQISFDPENVYDVNDSFIADESTMMIYNDESSKQTQSLEEMEKIARSHRKRRKIDF